MKKIGLVIALHIEAKCLIDYYKLKKNLAFENFEVFENKDIILIISGIGAIKVSIATTFLGLNYKDIKIINFGIAGGHKSYNIGQIYSINKIIDCCSDKIFFTELIYNFGIEETTLITYQKPQNQILSKNLVDMEGAIFFGVASVFYNLENIFIFKIVSDNGDFQNIKKEFVFNIIQSNITKIINIIEKIVNINNKKIILTEEDNKQINKIIQNLNLTKAQETILIKNVRYYKITNNNELNLENFLEIKSNNKNESKIIFNKILEFLNV